MADYTPSEMMVVRAARELKNGEVVFVGIGLPNVACNLARRLQAPGLVLIYESGAVGACPTACPFRSAIPAWPRTRFRCARWSKSSTTTFRAD